MMPSSIHCLDIYHKPRFHTITLQCQPFNGRVVHPIRALYLARHSEHHLELVGFLLVSSQELSRLMHAYFNRKQQPISCSMTPSLLAKSYNLRTREALL